MIFVNVLLGAINIVLFVLWLSLAKVEFSKPVTQSTYIYDNIAFSITLLEAFMTVLAVGLALLAVFGYTQIKESAIEAAKKEANGIADKEIKKFRDDAAIMRREHEEAMSNFSRSDVQTPQSGLVVPSDKREAEND